MASYTFRWSHHAEEVFVTGTFDDWSKSVRLEKANGGFEKYVVLPSAEDKILYKFVVDGHWTPDYGLACENDGSGNVNNVLWPSDLGRHVEPAAASSTKHMPASNSTESEQTYGVNPLPATAGYGNPVSLAEGESVPHHSNFTSNTLDSNVTLDKESYERSDRYPGAESTATDSTRDAFSMPAVTSTMIPESSLPMGSDATQELAHDTHPFVSSSAGTETSTAALAGQVPLEPRGVPSMVSESQHEAKIDPEASASAEAVTEKREVEEELLSKVPTAPATSEGAATGSTEAVAEKENVESDLKPTTSSGGIAGYVAAGTAAVAAGTTAMASTASSWLPASVQHAFTGGSKTEESTTTESGVPSTVTESYTKAHEDPEAAANPEAVVEKSAMERELLAEVPRTEESGEPAPMEDTPLATAVPKTSEATTTTAISGTEGALFGAGLGSVAARVFAAPAETLAGTTSSSQPSYTETYSSYTTTIPVQTEASTTTTLPSYPPTAPFSIPGETDTTTTKEVSSYAETSAPAVTSVEDEVAPTSTAAITELPTEPATTTTEATSVSPIALAAAKEASASTTPAAAVGGTEPATSTTEATSGLNAPASAPAQTIATEAKQIASGGAASSGPDKVITTPKKAEAAPTSTALPGTKMLPGSKSMSQAVKGAARNESRDLSPMSRSAAVAAANAASSSTATATTTAKSATQTPEKAKAAATGSAASTPASAASSSPAAMASKEDKRRKRTSFFGKLKEKFGSHK